MANENEPKSGFSAFWSKNSKKVFLSLLILVSLVLITTGGFWYYRYLNKDTLAVVGGEKITTTDLNHLIYGRNFGGTPDQPEIQLTEQERLDAIDGLVENKIIEIKAKELGLAATEEEILSNVSKSLESENGKNDGDTFYNSYTVTQKELTRENARINVLKDKVKNKELGWLSGKYLLVRFDKYNANIPEPVRIAVPKESDRASLTEKRRLEAETYTKTLVQRLNGGEDFETVRLSLATNPVLGYPGVSPQTPVMNGEIKRNDYLEGSFTEVNQFRSFNDEAAKIAKGQSAILPIIKTDAGDNLEFYVIYDASDKGGGYMYGYQNWLSVQKEQLLQKNKVAKLIEANTAKALAFTNDVCGMSGYGHAHCFVLRTYYTSRSGTETSINDYNFVLNAPGAAANEGLRLNGVSTDSIQMSTTSNGIVFYSYGAGDWEDYWNDYINCNETNQYKITFNENAGDDVSISGSIQSLGYWDNYINTSADSSVLTNSGIGSTHNDDSLYATICLDNSSCNGGESGWANGQSTTFGYHWYPHWNEAPVPNHVAPISGYSRTTAAAGQSVNISLTGEATDADADDTAVQLAFRAVGGQWKTFGCINDTNGPGGNTTQAIHSGDCAANQAVYLDNYGWKPTYQNTNTRYYHASGTDEIFPAYAFTAGSYEWAVRGLDEHGAFSSWTSSRPFTVSDPTVATLATLKSAVFPAGAATPIADQPFTTTTIDQQEGQAGYTNVNSAYNGNPTWSGTGCTVDGKHIFKAGDTDEVTCTATFTLKSVTPTCSITASPNPAGSVGGAVTLSYTTTNAASAAWAGAKSGTVSPLASGTAAGVGGSSYTINVTSSTGNTGACSVSVGNPGTYLLTVEKDVTSTGTGGVKSENDNVAGIDGNTFPRSGNMVAGADTTITATADADSTFVSWTNCDSGSSGNICKVNNIAAVKTVTVKFTANIVAGCSASSFTAFTGETVGVAAASSITVPQGSDVVFRFTPTTQTYDYFVDYGTSPASGSPARPNSGGVHNQYNSSAVAKLKCGTFNSPGVVIRSVTITVVATNVPPAVTLQVKIQPSDTVVPSGQSAGNEPKSVDLVGQATDTEGKVTTLTIGWYNTASGVGSSVTKDKYSVPVGGVSPLDSTFAATDVSGPRNLVAGNYSWFATAYDDQGAHTSIGGTFIVDVAPSLLCSVSPADTVEVGSPVEISITSGGGVAGPYDLQYFPTVAGTPIIPLSGVNTGRNITIDTAGTYTIQVQDNPDLFNLLWKTCTTTLEVKEPGGSGGGEKL